jgi:hypothetical protein
MERVFDRKESMEMTTIEDGNGVGSRDVGVAVVLIGRELDDWIPGAMESRITSRWVSHTVIRILRGPE